MTWTKAALWALPFAAGQCALGLSLGTATGTSIPTPMVVFATVAQFVFGALFVRFAFNGRSNDHRR